MKDSIVYGLTWEILYIVRNVVVKSVTNPINILTKFPNST